MTEIERLTAVLTAEQGALDEVVSTLSHEELMTATPSPGWNVIDQVSHLAYFDGTAALAIEDVAGFIASEVQMRSGGDVDRATLDRDKSLQDRLDRWRTNRERLALAATTLGDADRVRWYGPPMGARSFLTARLMECWAHGEDVRDSIGHPHSASERLRDIAVLGFNTRKWSYLNRGLEPPSAPVSVMLTSPAGAKWDLGPSDASDRIEGDALAFCQVVSQRRHVGDTRLTVTGPKAQEWMELAQIFAGPPTKRPPSKETRG